MNRATLGGLVLTAGVHAALVVALLVAHSSSAAPPRPPRDVVVAKLVRLGKPRDPRLLPRKPSAPPPTAPATPLSPNVDPNAAPTTPTPAPDPDAVAGDEFEKARLRAKAIGETYEEPEGSPEGSPAGTADTAAEGDPYATAIDAAIRAEWRVPDLVKPEQLAALACTVFVRIEADGTIVESAVLEPSRNRFFDGSVVEAIARVKKLPPPPSDRLREILDGGITIVFKP